MTGGPERSRDAAYFEALYARDPDPWDFETSAYEQEKYESTLAMLGGARFASGLEIGCSIGVLTQRLAAYCDRLLALDIAETALAQARTRCADLRHVDFAAARVPLDWPVGSRTFDLVVLSEVLYFLTPTDIGVLARRLRNTIRRPASVLLVNYTEAIDEPCGGHEAAEIFLAAARGFLEPARCEIHEKYRIDLLVTQPA